MKFRIAIDSAPNEETGELGWNYFRCPSCLAHGKSAPWKADDITLHCPVCGAVYGVAEKPTANFDLWRWELLYVDN
jgi:hypothetical protein